MPLEARLVDPRHPNYQSFLLRVWRAAPGEPWRGALHSTATGELCNFDTLDALWSCLVEQLGTVGNTPDPLLPDHEATRGG